MRLYDYWELVDNAVHFRSEQRANTIPWRLENGERKGKIKIKLNYETTRIARHIVKVKTIKIPCNSVMLNYANNMP